METAVAVINAMAYVRCAVADVCWPVTSYSVTDVCGPMTDVGRPVAEVRGAMASEAQHDRSQGEQCAEDETREKDGFHGAVWLVVYSSSL